MDTNNAKGETIPIELKFKDSDLNDVDLTNKKGNIMILNFWATWCAPCKREMPSLEKLTNQFPQVNALFISFPLRFLSRIGLSCWPMRMAAALHGVAYDLRTDARFFGRS